MPQPTLRGPLPVCGTTNPRGFLRLSVQHVYCQPEQLDWPNTGRNRGTEGVTVCMCVGLRAVAPCPSCVLCVHWHLLRRASLCLRWWWWWCGCGTECVVCVWGGVAAFWLRPTRVNPVFGPSTASAPSSPPPLRPCPQPLPMPVPPRPLHPSGLCTFPTTTCWELYPLP